MNQMDAFIADGMFGKLARWLRLAGCDTLYLNTERKSSLVRLAREDNRRILTRDRMLAQEADDVALYLASEDTVEQLRQLREKGILHVLPGRFFTRCCFCNDILQPRSKSDIEGRVPGYVFRNHERFSECPRCRRIFWEGDHWKRIREILELL